MKHIRFYLEHDDPAHKRRGEHNGNVVAIQPELSRVDFVFETPTSKPQFGLLYDAVGAVYFYPDSPVASTSVSALYLRTQCKRISEAEARSIHPNLFKYLDESED